MNPSKGIISLKQIQKKTTTVIPSIYNSQKQSIKQMRQNLHLIINKSSYMGLRKQIKATFFKAKNNYQNNKQKKSTLNINPKDVINSMVRKNQDHQQIINVMGCMADQNNLSHLWAFIPDKQYPAYVYIVHIQSGLALRLNDQKITLAPRIKNNKDYLFHLELRPGIKSLYEHSIYIRSYLNRKYLTLKGILKIGEPVQSDECQQFYLKKVGLYSPSILKEAFILSNPLDQDKGVYCLQPDQNYEQISYGQMNYHLEQRWKFQGLKPKLRNQQMDKIMQEDIHIQQNDKTNKMQQLKVKQTVSRTKFDDFAFKNTQIVQKTAMNIVEQIDHNQLCEIVNLKTNTSLSLKQIKGSKFKLALAQRPIKPQWKIQTDQFSMKILHLQRKQYLGVEDKQIVLKSVPFYWSLFEGFQDRNIRASMGGSGIGQGLGRKGSI